MQNKECVNAQTNYIKRYLFQLRICYTVTNENAYPVHYGLVLQHSFVCIRLKCVEFCQMNFSSDLIWYELRKFDTGLNKVNVWMWSISYIWTLDLSHSIRYSELEVCQQQDKKSICMEQVVAMILSCCFLIYFKYILIKENVLQYRPLLPCWSLGRKRLRSLKQTRQ